MRPHLILPFTLFYHLPYFTPLAVAVTARATKRPPSPGVESVSKNRPKGKMSATTQETLRLAEQVASRGRQTTREQGRRLPPSTPPAGSPVKRPPSHHTPQKPAKIAKPALPQHGSMAAGSAGEFVFERP